MSDAAIRRAPVTLALARLTTGGARLGQRLARMLEDHPVGPSRAAALARLAAAAPPETRREAARLEARLAAEGTRFVGPADPGYPVGLAGRADPPPALFVRGDLAALAARCLGVTGARRAGPAARSQAWMLGHLARRCGITLVSGWTSASEEAVVRAALAGPGAGRVVLLQPYGPELPAGLEGVVAGVVRAGGAVVSAWPPGLPPLGRAHRLRSRLLGALADDLVVLEAGASSGALVAAEVALAGSGDVWVPAPQLEAGPEGAPRGGEGLARLRERGARRYRHPLELVIPGLPGVPWRPRETRVVERYGALAPDRLLHEAASDPVRVGALCRQGWLQWTPDGRIGAGFEPILEAMSRRFPGHLGSDPRRPAPGAEPAESVLV